ncbi:DedA family protein [Angustibacter sp. McL0619]|uniref:DedA family protein n=1 Tax=Angustibacter sp. McL0619 TaxID=3415676 RepID=UPI003CE7138B
MSEWLSALFHPDLAGYTAFGLYVVLFGLIFIETGLLVGFFLPGDTVLFTAGLLAAHPGSPLSLPALVVGVAAAAVLGDAVAYLCGRRLGRPWVERRAGRLARHLPQTEAFFERWGWSAVVVARFIPWLRTFTPIVAGTAAMPYPRFLGANVVGALLWGSGLVLTGYVAYSVPWVRYAAYAIALASILTSIIGPLVVRRRRSTRPAAAPAPPGS